jgi:hypothetical protein
MKNNLIISLIFCLTCFNSYTQIYKDSLKVNELEEVILESKTEFIRRKADRTIFNFSDQPMLSTGSLKQSLRKLPGLIVSEVVGISFQGKQLSIHLDGRPTNLNGENLDAFLESLPADSILEIEIITQAGSEYPSTFGGAILNIITKKTSEDYFNASVNSNSSFSNYSKLRFRFNNVLNINSKNEFFDWKLQLGQNYKETFQINNFSIGDILISENEFDKIGRFYFIRPSFKFNFNKVELFIDYDFNNQNDNSEITSNNFGLDPVPFLSDLNTNSNEINIKLDKKFDNNNSQYSKFDFELNLKDTRNRFEQQSLNTNQVILHNTFENTSGRLTSNVSKEINFLDQSTLSSGLYLSFLNFQTNNISDDKFNYRNHNEALYFKLSSSFKDYNIIMGIRLENYRINGLLNDENVNDYNKFNFFPNITAQYNLSSDIFASISYSRKISLPSISDLNPNNNNLRNNNIEFSGNPTLIPSISNNYDFTLSAFEFAYLSYSINSVRNQIVTRFFEDEANINQSTSNISKITVQQFNFGLPVPFMIFYKKITDILEMDINPDNINYFYFDVGYYYNKLPEVNSVGYWNFNLMTKINFTKTGTINLSYNTSTTGGNYFYYDIDYPLNNQLDITINKQFFEDKLSLNLTFLDVFNTNKLAINAVDTNIEYENKVDTRRLILSINYKI